MSESSLITEILKVIMKFKFQTNDKTDFFNQWFLNFLESYIPLRI